MNNKSTNKKQALGNLSIGKKLVIAMVITSGLITLVITAIQMYGFYKEGLNEIDDRLADIKNIHVLEISEKLWVSDIESIKQYVNGITKFDAVKSISIFEKDKLLYNSDSEEGENEAYVKSFNLEYNYKNENIILGRMDIFITLNTLHEQLINRVLSTLVANTTKTFFVGFVVLFLFNYLLTRHLLTISNYFNAYNTSKIGNDDLVLERNNNYKEDELDIVVQAVNRMNHNIIEAVSDIEIKNSELEADKKRAETLLNLVERSFTSESGLIKYGLEAAVNLIDSKTGTLVIESNSKGKKSFEYKNNKVEEKIITLQDTTSCINCVYNNFTIFEPGESEVCLLDNEDSNQSSQRKLCVPIINNDNAVGYITIKNKDVPYTDRDAVQLELYVQSLWTMITRIRAEKELTRSKKDYKSLLETSLAIPWTIDVESKQYSHVGIQAENVFGHLRSDWYQDEFRNQYIHHEDLDLILNKYENAIANQDEFRAKYRIFSKTGEEHWVLDYGNIINDGEGNTSLQGFMFDITEQEKQDSIVRRSMKAQAIDTLAGGIAHDYNNMLGVIMGYSELLMAGTSGDEKLAKYSQQIHLAAKRGASLTNKLLKFSKDNEISVSTVELNKLLTDDKDMLRTTLTPKINIVYELSPEVGYIHVDEHGLEDAIINICINAMHAMPTGGKLILRTEHLILDSKESQIYQIKEGNYIQLSIIDEGIGMNKDMLEQIFDPFFSTKGEQGTGLGLSQVFGFVRASSANINVISEPGKGTNISIMFPQYFGNKVSYLENGTSIGKSLNGTERILVVDDEPALCDLAMDFLTGHGYTVETKLNGEEALQELSKSKYDLALLDIIMPGMSGYQLADKIRELYPSIKIQFCSGYSKDDRGKPDDKSALNIMKKPYSKVELLTQVRTLLDS